MRILLLFLSLSLMLGAASVAKRFPSASYVLSELDLDEGYLYEPAFVHFVQKYEKKMARFYQKSIHRSGDLLPLLRGTLMEEDLSDLFLYLSIVESGLHTDAVSYRHAKGLWQFMPNTAREYHLSVNPLYDERYDPKRATAAAIAYLRHLHRKFGKWYLAILAYNCGEGRLQKALRKAGTDDAEILLDDERKYLPKETRDYLRKVLLIAMIGESETIDAEDTASVPETVRVEVKPGTDLRRLANLLQTDASKLLAMNPALKNGMVPEGMTKCTVAIPASKMARFFLKYDTAEQKSIENSCLISHKVVLGETLEMIAAKYGSSVSEIKRINHMKHDMLEVDRLLLIPVSKAYFNAVSQKRADKRNKQI